MDDTCWRQINLAYPGHTPHEREQHAVPHLAQILPAAASAGLITSWWFIRKGPWRIRYLPADNHTGPDPIRPLLTATVPASTDIYEPETFAFGGPDSMAAAHHLFHHDSHHLLTYLDNRPGDRREHSLILSTALMRTAGLDLNEQGAVWAGIAERRGAHPRQLPPPDRRTWTAFTDSVRCLLVGTPVVTGDWHTAFDDTGTTLKALRETGRLSRGIRAVITEHVLFHWNRIGIPATTQATLAKAAQEAIFGATNPSAT